MNREIDSQDEGIGNEENVEWKWQQTLLLVYAKIEYIFDHEIC